MLYSIVALLVVILDQAVKFWVTKTLMGYDIVKFIPGVISLVNVPNDGAAFSMLSGGGARIYFIIATVVFCVAVIIALASNFITGRVARWSLVMVAAGGFSNCIDRVINGYVVDMFKVELFNFAIFNVADIFITVFAIVFALAIIFERNNKDDDEDEEEDDAEDEDEEEEPRPSLFARLRRRDAEEDEEDERPVRRGKKAKYEDEYEQYKASQQPGRTSASVKSRESAAGPRDTAASSRPTQPAPRPRATSPNPSDPFAEWERANAKVNAQRTNGYASKPIEGFGPNAAAAKPAAPQQAPVYQPPVQQGQKPAVPQVQPSVQQPAPQPKPEPAPSTEFDLDDILNEFK